MKKSFRFRKRSQNVGFTLVELVIVIAIVIILSVISVPIYRGYVDKAKMAEGYALLGTIISAQKSYYSEYGYFWTSAWMGMDYRTSYNEYLGIDARSNKYFTFFTITSASNQDPRNYFASYVPKPNELVNDVIKNSLRIRFWVTAPGGSEVIGANITETTYA